MACCFSLIYLLCIIVSRCAIFVAQGNSVMANQTLALPHERSNASCLLPGTPLQPLPLLLHTRLVVVCAHLPRPGEPTDRAQRGMGGGSSTRSAPRLTTLARPRRGRAGFRGGQASSRALVGHISYCSAVTCCLLQMGEAPRSGKQAEPTMLFLTPQ